MKIPDLDAVLEVTPVTTEQEIVSTAVERSKYEGASAVSGVYRGKETAGYCYVELVGVWE